MTVYELPDANPNKVYQGQIPYGLHIPFNQGYDANSRANLPRAEDVGSSGNFYSPALGAQIELWITEVSADFALSGSIGQSRMLREFFPHSFNDVTLNITGNVASTQEYNRLAGFIRQSHWQALQNINQGSNATQTLTFTLYNTYGQGQQWRPGRNVKGPHRPWTVDGYVTTIAAGATHWETAPQFSIGFVVTSSELSGSTGIWSDTPDNGGSTLKSMLQLLGINTTSQTSSGPGFVQDPIAPPAPAVSLSTKGIAKQVQAASKDLGWSVRAAVKQLSL